MDTLKHGKGGKGSQPERKRQARTSSRLVPRLTQFHLASAGVQWWKREDRNFRLQERSGVSGKDSFFERRKEKPRVPLGYRGKDPPPVSPICGVGRAGTQWEGHPRCTPTQPAHPAGPATSVCSVCRGRARAPARGGGNVQKGHQCVPPPPALCQPYTPPHPAGQDTSVRRAVSRPERWVNHCTNHRTAVASQWVPVGSTVLRGHQDQPCAPCAVHRPCAARGASRAPGSWGGGLVQPGAPALDPGAGRSPRVLAPGATVHVALRPLGPPLTLPR